MLSHLRFLKLLDLRGNACTDDPDYRVMIIHTIPSVEVLDSRMVKQEERRAAAIHLGESSAQAAQTIAFGKLPMMQQTNFAFPFDIPCRGVMQEEGGRRLYRPALLKISARRNYKTLSSGCAKEAADQ